jgi:MYXO-CTERM domain-containing protein
MRRSSFLTLALLLVASPAAAQPGLWPGFRHDGQRTGRASGAGAIDASPAFAWTRGIGGSLSPAQSVIADLDGDGQHEVVLASGGGVVVRGADDHVRVRSALFGADTILGVADLDGTGAPEIVAHGTSPRGVFVIDAGTGHTLLSLPVVDLRVGVAAVPRATGGADLIVRDYAGAQGQLVLYGTSASLASPATLWTATLPDYDVDRSVGLADLDGDGAPEVVAPNDRGFSAFALADGTLRWNTSTIPDASYTPAYAFQWTTANVDGVAGDEIIALDTSYYYSEDTALSVLGTAGTGALHVLWQVYRHDDVTAGSGNDVGRTFFHVMADAVADLDGDGTTELVYSEWDARTAPGHWTLYVVDAATGATVGQRNGADLSAVADIDGDHLREIVLRDAGDANAVLAQATPLFATLHAFDFGRRTGMIDKGWALDRAAPVLLPAYRERRNAFDLGFVSSSVLTVSTHQDVDVAGGDLAEELYVYFDAADEFTNQERPTDIEAIHGADGRVRADYVIPRNTLASVLALTDALASPTARAEALVAVNDGLARVIDHAFAPEGTLTEGNFAQLPIVVSFDGTSAAIAVVDSTETLQLFDATRSMLGEPVVSASVRGVEQTWSRGYVNAPGVVATVLGTRALVVRGHSHVNWQDQSLVALDAMGNERWRSEVGHGRSIAGFDNAEAFDLDHDGTDDVVTSEINVMGGEEIVAHNGRDGTAVRRIAVGPMLSVSGISVTPGAYFQGHASVDVSGDGVPDLVGALHPQWFVAVDVSSMPPHALWAAQSPSGTEAMVNGQAIVAGFAADGSDRILRVNAQNAFGPYTRFSLSGAIEAQVAPVNVVPNVPETDMNDAAVITHEGTPARFDFVTAGMSGAAMGSVTRYDGVAMSASWTVYLAGGLSSTTAPASAAQLYDPIVLDVDGDGHDDVVVGSDEGWLYALHGTDGSLIWALPSASPVVFVIAANLDEDPALELLCSRLDGTLAAVDRAGMYTWTSIDVPDAGMPDAGPPVDAWVAPVDMGPADGGPGRGHPATSSGGCGCRAAGQGAGRGALAWMLLALGVVAMRRARRA